MLTEHFSAMLKAKKDSIRENGSLTPLQVYTLEQAVADGRVPTATTMKEHLHAHMLDGMMVDDLLQKNGKPTSLSVDERITLINEYRRALGAYSKSVLEFDATDQAYELEADAAPVAPPERAASSPAATSLNKLVDAWIKFATIENRWTDKTKGEKTEHIALLYEALGEETSIGKLDRAAACEIRDILVAYPVNRFKMPATKGKTLAELRDLKSARTLHPLTINKYLQTYSGLFGWAKQNGYVSDNVFEGLNLDTGKVNTEAPRLPFPDNAITTIYNALLDGHRQVQPHHVDFH